MRLVALLSTFALVACSTAPAARKEEPVQNAALNPTVEYLLTSAATDFHTHRPPFPARFRNVRSGYLMNSDGTRQYLLCGEFLPAGQGSTTEWIQFVTIKTSGYEQYLGGHAAYCGRPALKWDKENLSSVLQSRLDSLQ